MDYILIFILQILGIGFHVSQKVYALDKLSPDDDLKTVFVVFWRSDRITVFISAFVVLLHEVIHFAIEYYNFPIRHWENYLPASLISALLFGYFGQRKIYDFFSKAEKALDKKVDAIADK